MSAVIIDILKGYRDSNGDNRILAKIACDTVADLPAPAAFTGGVLAMGSEAEIIADGSTYKMDSAGNWHQQPAGGGGGGGGDYYTKSQIDAMLALLQPLSITQMISAGTDLDTVVALGAYEYTAADAASITSKPAGATAAARMDVQQLPDSQLQQLLRTIDTSSVQIYVRNSQGSTTPVEQQLVPAMTSDTTPSGQVIYSGQYQTRYGYQAFDGVNSQTWQSNSWGDGTNHLTGDPAECYIGYIFTQPEDVTKFILATSSDRQYTAIIQLQINGAWSTAVQAITIPGTGYSEQTITLQAATTCTGIRLSITGGAEPYFTTGMYGGNVCELYVYGMQQSFSWSSWYQYTLA